MEGTHHTLVLRTLLATNRNATSAVANPTRKKLAASCLVTTENLKMLVFVNGSVASMLETSLIHIKQCRKSVRESHSARLAFGRRRLACAFRFFLLRFAKQGLRRFHASIRLIFESFTSKNMIATILTDKPSSYFPCCAPVKNRGGSNATLRGWGSTGRLRTVTGKRQACESGTDCSTPRYCGPFF